jgi:hypothetical protein
MSREYKGETWECLQMDRRTKISKRRTLVLLRAHHCQTLQLLQSLNPGLFFILETFMSIQVMHICIQKGLSTNVRSTWQSWKFCQYSLTEMERSRPLERRSRSRSRYIYFSNTSWSELLKFWSSRKHASHHITHKSRQYCIYAPVLK